MSTDELSVTVGTGRRGRRWSLFCIFVLSALGALITVGSQVDAGITARVGNTIGLFGQIPVSPALAAFLGGLFGVALLVYRRVKGNALFQSDASSFRRAAERDVHRRIALLSSETKNV